MVICYSSNRKLVHTKITHLCELPGSSGLGLSTCTAVVRVQSLLRDLKASKTRGATETKQNTPQIHTLNNHTKPVHDYL